MLDIARSPLEFACTNCQSKPSVLCTQPTDSGRRYVQWFHLVRETAAREAAQQEATEPRAEHPEHWKRHGHEGSPCPVNTTKCYGGAQP